MEYHRKPDLDGFNKRVFTEGEQPRAVSLRRNFTGNRVLVISVVVMFFLFAGSVGAYNFFQKYAFQKLQKDALEKLEGGDYSAALSLYNKMDGKRAEDAGISEMIEEARALLVAEENFIKAQIAASEEKWIDVEILLKNSDALTNPDFKFYESALILFEKAQGLVDSYEKEVSDTITGLKKNIADEENKRKQAERSGAQVASELQTVSSQKNQTEQNLQTTQQQLNETQNQAAMTQSQLEQERLRAEELAREAEREKLKKLGTEMWIYVGMLKDGNNHLNSAISEIEKSNDVAAFTFISRARDLFNDTKEKATDLYQNRTPYEYQSTVNNIIESANKFTEAGQLLSKAIINISDKGSADFINSFEEGKSVKIQAYQLTNTVPEFN
ncbi:MAG: hypothetical protein ABII97_00490 [Patescibacteria group bacterium]